MPRYTTFPLIRFKPRFSAVLQNYKYFKTAEGYGCFAEGRGRFTFWLR